MQLDSYDATDLYDEMFESGGRPRRGAQLLFDRLEELSTLELQRYQNTAMATMRNLGITFNVYGHAEGTEKIWPLDIIPRVISQHEWQHIERGLKQRVLAINAFLQDVYNEQRIIKQGLIPRELIESCDGYRKACDGLKPPLGIWAHINGVDLVRDKTGTIYVLEDNGRVPSGVSYVLENRAVMKRAFPKVFDGLSVSPVEDYPERLLQMLISVAPRGVDEPVVVVWTPGIYNSAYFEHSVLARQMGVKLVQASDMVVHRGRVHMRTTRGLQQIDVIYRRVDDNFMDPLAFRADSLLGVPGLMEVYRNGLVTLANAPGTGVGDDKAIYAYVPEFIKYYLGEDAILPNVPTYLCHRQSDRKYVLDNLSSLVVKPTNASGGKGIVMGPWASKAELAECRAQLEAEPRNFIAQPALKLSTVPTLIEGAIESRHVDLRPFVLCGEDVYVLPGGLTRVALVRGSMVVNSSQGGGSKDTWVIGDC